MSYLPTPSNAQRSNQPILALSPLLSQYTLHQRQHACTLEQLSLSRIFLKDTRKGKFLDGPFAVVVGRRLDGDVRGVVVGIAFDGEEAVVVDGRGGAEAEVDVEQRCG